MLTIAQCLKCANKLSAISDSARLDIEILLSRALHKPRVYLYTWPEKYLSAVQTEVFTNYLRRRQGGEPIAYIIGEKEFWSLPLKVNGAALIPRPETELVVEKALLLLPECVQDVVDLGTGSGAIALALASERPQWQLLAVDKYAGAVALAEENRRCLQLDNVTVLQSEWLKAVEQSRRFNLLVSNPPYIDSKDVHLSQGDVQFEPCSALVAAERGMADIRIVVEQAIARLYGNGWLIVEHGCQQGEAVRQLFSAAGFEQVITYADISGLERVTAGQYLS